MQLHCRGFFFNRERGEGERERKQIKPIKIGGTLTSDGKTFAVDQIDKKIETQIHDKTFKSMDNRKTK